MRRSAFAWSTASLLALALLGAGSGGCQGDECAQGATRCGPRGIDRCERDCGDFGCGNLQWFYASSCSSGQSCLQQTAARALCVESDAPDPRCSATGAGSYCEGDAVATCVDGYRTRTTPCNDASNTTGFVASMTCVFATSGATSGATCVPREAQRDARCASGAAAICDGSLLVECVAGLAASITACAHCDASAPTNCTSCSARHGACTGYLGLGCKLDGDCAPGLTCHVLGSYGGVCSTTCTVGTDDCQRTFAAGGPPVSAWTPVWRPDAKLACIDGYCAWEP